MKLCAVFFTVQTLLAVFRVGYLRLKDSYTATNY